LSQLEEVIEFVARELSERPEKLKLDTRFWWRWRRTRHDFTVGDLVEATQRGSWAARA
jgi:hypothetical protein